MDAAPARSQRTLLSMCGTPWRRSLRLFLSAQVPILSAYPGANVSARVNHAYTKCSISMKTSVNNNAVVHFQLKPTEGIICFR